MAKLKTTRNTAFNGYEYTDAENLYYASIATTSIEDIKKITKKSYSNIKLLDYDDYVKVKGSDIISYTQKNKVLLDDDLIDSYRNIIENTELNTENKDFYIYGAPYKMVLDNLQSYGDCGVVSVLNNLVNAEIMTIKDQDKTEKSFLKKMWELGCVSDNGKIGVLDKPDGGTSTYHWENMFKLYNVESTTYFSYTDIDELAQKVKQGYGVILSVNSDQLSYGYSIYDNELDHAVSIIGVVFKNQNNGLYEIPTAFIIHDTACQMTRFITPEDLKQIGLYNENRGFNLLITEEPIKEMANNINATGDKYDNIIYGNSGNNVIKGLDGNDVLYGDSGDDKIYGGKGKDTIYGGAGNDILYGGDGNDTIYGEFGNNIIYGGKGNDIIYGGNSNINVIYGENGNDIIYCGNYINRVVAGKGNDTIYGGEGINTIITGDGNDTIYSGLYEDKIATGSGNDTIIFGSPDLGLDKVQNSKGSITLKFEYDINEYNMKSFIEENTDTHNYDFYFTDKNIKKGVILEDFFNYKKNISQKVYIETDTNKQYRISATKSSKATVADIRTDGKHKNINNILFTTNKKGTTITTSKKNDIVYMYDSPGYKYKEEEFNRCDKITYTGGKDTYISFIGNTTYSVNFNQKTYLQIIDNVSKLKKISYDEDDMPYINEISASTNDVIKFSSSIEDIVFFFDVDKTGNIATKTNLYALYKTEDNSDIVKNNMISIASNKNTDSMSGFVSMAEFFGNGKIEKIYTNENGKSVLYNDLYDKTYAIRSAVFNWLQNSDYDSVFEALSSNETQENIASLIACYTNNNI